MHSNDSFMNNRIGSCINLALSLELFADIFRQRKDGSTS